MQAKAGISGQRKRPIGKFYIVCYIPQKPTFIIFTMEHGKAPFLFRMHWHHEPDLHKSLNDE